MMTDDNYMNKQRSNRIDNSSSKGKERIAYIIKQQNEKDPRTRFKN